MRDPKYLLISHHQVAQKKSHVAVLRAHLEEESSQERAATSEIANLEAKIAITTQKRQAAFSTRGTLQVIFFY